MVTQNYELIHGIDVKIRVNSPLSPVIAVQRSIIDRLADVVGLYILAATQIGYGPRDLQDAVVSTGR